MILQYLQLFYKLSNEIPFYKKMPIKIRNHKDVRAPYKPPRKTQRQVLDLNEDYDSEPEEIQINGRTWFIRNGKKTEVIDLTGEEEEHPNQVIDLNEDYDSEEVEDEEEDPSDQEWMYDPTDPRFHSRFDSEEICTDDEEEEEGVDETDVEEEPPLKKQKM